MVEFNIRYSYFPELEPTVRSGQRIDDKYLAEALAWHAGGNLPVWLTEYLEKLEQGELPKPDRMAAASCRFEAGQVWLQHEAPWLANLLNELLAFPAGKHDDQVDSISQFLNWVQDRPRPQVISMFGGEVITGD